VDHIWRGGMPMIRRRRAGARRSSSPSCHARARRKSNSPEPTFAADPFEPPHRPRSPSHAIRPRPGTPSGRLAVRPSVRPLPRPSVRPPPPDVPRSIPD
jgi:hypothetical protein